MVFAPEPLREYRDYLTKVDDDLSTLAWLYHMNHGIFMTPGRRGGVDALDRPHRGARAALPRRVRGVRVRPDGGPRPSRTWQTASRTRPARTSCSTRTTRSTGTRGATRRSPRAQAEDKPILLSIGYSACHWCHVMEHESFEDPETAALMNEHFVPIKVDREERPDVDTIYMEAVQAMTGHGGWPLTVFLDPDGVPFFGGTYFPPEQRHGMPSFRQVLEGVVRGVAHAPRRDQGGSAAHRRGPERDRAPARRRTPSPRRERARSEAEHGLAAQFDPDFGGFGGAPKFPPASALEFLLARIADGATATDGAARWCARTLERMARGGIYDQVGGGFARYAVDAHWLVPHFEKMLYDNALLARAYLARLAGHRRRRCYRRVCEETLDWALREMRGPEGGFYSALDADTEGEEGKFYVWTEPELREVLGEDADRAARATGASTAARTSRAAASSTSQGDEIDPRAARACPAAAVRRPLAARVARSRRQAPDRVERADGRGTRGRGRRARHATTTSTPRASARTSCSTRCATTNGRLMRTYKDGRASLDAYLEDHAFLSEALLVLYEATLETRWFVASASGSRTTSCCASAIPKAGGFFDTASDHESLVVRPRSFEDHPIPSGELVGRQRACCGSSRSRATAPTSTGARGLPPAAPGDRAAPAGVRPPAPGDALPLLHAARGRARRRAARRAGGRRAPAIPPHDRPGGHAARRRARHPTPSRCCEGASPSTASRLPTCARTSRAGCPSPIPRSSRQLLA